MSFFDDDESFYDVCRRHGLLETPCGSNGLYGPDRDYEETVHALGAQGRAKASREIWEAYEGCKDERSVVLGKDDFFRITSKLICYALGRDGAWYWYDEYRAAGEAISLLGERQFEAYYAQCYMNVNGGVVSYLYELATRLARRAEERHVAVVLATLETDRKKLERVLDTYRRRTMAVAPFPVIDMDQLRMAWRDVLLEHVQALDIEKRVIGWRP